MSVREVTMRIALILSGAFVLALAAAALSADEGAGTKPGGDGAPLVIHRPQDVAPPELVINARPASDYRPEGSLLRQAVHHPRQVDVDELARRQIAMFEGKTFTGEMPAADAAVADTPLPTPAPPNDGDERAYAHVFYWSVTVASALAGFWLMLKTVLWLMRPKRVPAGRRR